LDILESLALVLWMKYRQFPWTRTRRTLTQVYRFAVYLGLLYRFLIGLWSYDQKATALWGRGSFAFIVQRQSIAPSR